MPEEMPEWGNVEEVEKREVVFDKGYMIIPCPERVGDQWRAQVQVISEIHKDWRLCRDSVNLYSDREQAHTMSVELAKQIIAGKVKPRKAT